jgi:3-methyl-2-oxobutanoate hydroxymethyltransferase
MSVAKKDYKRITTKSLIEMKANGEKISMLTAYECNGRTRNNFTYNS